MSLKRFVIFIVLVVAFSYKGYAQIPITFNIESSSGMQGDVVCVDFTLEDFLKVSSMQMVIAFDPNVVQLDTPIVVSNSALNANGMNELPVSFFNLTRIDDGFVNFIWVDTEATGQTLNDGDILFTLCFLLVGNPCESSNITITETGSVPFEFIAIDCITGLDNDFVPIVNSGELTIDPDGYSISTAFCSTADGNDTGSITFSGSGGTGPYQWEVSPSGASGSGLADCDTASVSNLGPGNYTITFIDANGVSRSEIVTIASNSSFPFEITLAGTNPTCFSNDNGTVIVTDIEGGEAPFDYEWSTFQFLKDTIVKLGAGDYGLTITDINGCTASSEISLDVEPLVLSYEIIAEPSCDSTSNGIVSIFAVGGTPFMGNNYEFDIDGIIVGNDTTNYFGGSIQPTNPFTPSNLPSGCFEVTASDNATTACNSEPLQFCIEAGAFATLEIDVDSITCFGLCNGAVEMIASNFGDYNFTITDPDGVVTAEMNSLSYMADNLCGGTYNVTIEDLNAGCTKDTFFVVVEPELLELIVIDSIGPGCGGGDGMINFGVNGGTEDYTFLWNDAYDQPSRMSMGGGDYSITVTDMNGCQDSIAFSFADGGDILLNAFVCSAVSCRGVLDGSICASVGVAGAYTYTWADANGIGIGTGSQIDGVGSGTYYVTATDGMCTDTDTVFVVPGQLVSVNVVQVDPTCFNSSDGTLTATLATGTNPASFVWTEPPSTAPLSMGAVLLDGVGNYNLHVTDANGCEEDIPVTMNPPANVINVDITNIIANPCFGECQGTATFTASGGTAMLGVYAFSISGTTINPGSDQAIVDVLCGGDGWVIASDGICESDTLFFTIPDADPISLNESASTIEPPSCAGGNDGSISIEVQGGDDSSYDIFWVSEGVAGSDLMDLTSGMYIYNVTDGSNCVFLDTIFLEAPDSLLVTVNPLTTTDISCFTGSMGRIGLTVTGGNSGQLTFDWDPAISNNDSAENLGPGIYSVTVTDSKGCTGETSYELTSADPIQMVLDIPEEPDCFGGVTCIGVDTAFGGVGFDFSFALNNGPRFSLDTCINVFAGPYLLTVFDSAGCSIDTMIMIDQPDEIIVDLGPDLTIILGEDTGPVSALIASELDIDSILWSPTTDLECNTMDCQVVTLSPLGTTDYTVTVIDENGCLGTDDITVFVDLARNVFFPNIFSPNGDNQNDFFQLATGSGVLEVSYFRLYDRWGNKMYEEMAYMPDDSLHPGWNGTFNNKEVDSGVYVYFAEVLFLDNVRVVYKGDVTLVR